MTFIDGAKITKQHILYREPIRVNSYFLTVRHASRLSSSFSLTLSRLCNPNTEGANKQMSSVHEDTYTMPFIWHPQFLEYTVLCTQQTSTGTETKRRTPQFRLNSITHAESLNQQIKAKFHYASWFEAGRRPASNLSATSFEPASNHI